MKRLRRRPHGLSSLSPAIPEPKPSSARNSAHSRMTHRRWTISTPSSISMPSPVKRSGCTLPLMVPPGRPLKQTSSHSQNLSWAAMVSYIMRFSEYPNDIFVACLCATRTKLMCGTNRIGKGETVIIPISLINTSPEIWGADARQFK